MNRIILTRHGQTEWNLQQRLQGHRDSPLTETGRQQARRAALALRDIPIARAYCSPLQRATETAAIITADRDIEIIACEDFKEMNLGPWEGKTRSETELSHPQQYHDCWNRQDLFNLEGAETFARLQQRIVSGIDRIFNHEQGDILVVSHWLAIKTALAWFNNISLADLNNLPDIENGKFVMLCKGDNQVTVSTI